MNKKKVFLLLVLIVIIAVVVCFGIKNKENISNNIKEETNDIQKLAVQDLYEYGERIEQMDIAPNTIVARFNGEEILFHEVESYRMSINYSIENGHSDLGGKSAFYEVLKNKLYCCLAKKYSDESNVAILNIESDLARIENEWNNGNGEDSVEEYRKEWLSVLGIEENEIWLDEEDFIVYLQNLSVNQRLISKGISIILDFMLEKPELAKDKELESKVEKIKNIQEKQQKLMDEDKREEAVELTGELSNLLTEVREIYIQDLILNAEIELCVDNNELSYTIPTIYQEKNDELDDKQK